MFLKKFLIVQDRIWHSWDPHPWKHPWLTKKNLSDIKEFSNRFFEKEKKILESTNPEELSVAFCGNIANAMYVRAVPLRNNGMRVKIYIHPQDNYIMSQPCWEEYEGTIPDGITNLGDLQQQGICFPEVDDVFQFETVNVSEWQSVYSSSGFNYLNKKNILDFEKYLSNIVTLNYLQGDDVAWSTQAVYFPYLARRPYVASQSGGDMWFEASRGDEFGRLMRQSFSNARVLLASNPWSFAHARRFGFKHMVYLPKILDENVYHSGHGNERKNWIENNDGDFYVLTTSRLDKKNKGSNIGIEGFARFSAKYPGARLVFVGWGKDSQYLESTLAEMGINNKVIRMPVSGKSRLRDYLRSADVFIDQFVLGYFGSAGLEALACGLPVIGRIETEQYDALCETGAPPILNCSTAEDVAKTLEAMYQSSALLMKTREESTSWFTRNHGSKRWLDEHRALLVATAKKMPVSFRESSLSSWLTKTEKKYHKDGLLQAPTTMEYGW